MNYNDSSAVFIVYYSYICGTKTDVTVKIIQLIFILLTIVSNEIVVEFVLSDDQKIILLESLGQETETEKTELEGESEVDYVNEYILDVYFDNQDFQSSLDRNISNITNPFLEIHSPPPEIR